MASLTIAAAARYCGVARRTLQSAIKSGRLSLTPDHRLTLEGLAQAGYAPATGPQGQTAAAPPQPPHRDMTQELGQALASLIARLDRLISLLETLHVTPISQRQPTGTPKRTPQRRRQAPPQRQLYDPAAALARLLTLKSQGLSLSQIAATLNTEGVPTRHGRPWHKGTVGYLLQRAGQAQS